MSWLVVEVLVCSRECIECCDRNSSAPLRKNAVSALQILCKLYFFSFGRLLKKIADDQCSFITKGSIHHMKYNVHTTFYHSSGLTRNLMSYGSIYKVSYLQILRFYLVGQTVLAMYSNQRWTLG